MDNFEIPFPSEKVIEDFVCDSLDRCWCPVSKEGVSGYLRQHRVEGYGITDVVKIQASSESVALTVLELKNVSLNESHLSQLARYMCGLKRQAARYEKRLGIEIDVYGQLAGPMGGNSGDLVFLVGRLTQIEVYHLSLDMKDGFSSSKVGGGWYRKDENLSGGKELARICYSHFVEENEIELAQAQAMNVVEMRRDG